MSWLKSLNTQTEVWLGKHTTCENMVSGHKTLLILLVVIVSSKLLKFWARVRRRPSVLEEMALSF